MLSNCRVLGHTGCCATGRLDEFECSVLIALVDPVGATLLHLAKPLTDCELLDHR